MKTTTFALILLTAALAAWAQPAPTPRHVKPRSGQTSEAPAAPAPSPFPPAAPPTAPNPADAGQVPGTVPTQPVAPAVAAVPKSPPEEMIPAGNINFQGVDVNQVLDVYAKLVGRTVLRAGLPQAQIVLRTETPLTKTEAIEALQAVLALNGIALVNMGDKFVKALPVGEANSAGGKIQHGEANQLPDLGSYVTHIVQLKYIKPTAMVPIIQPFAKLPNSILPIDDNGILVLRDNAENVKRMLEMIDQVDVSVPAEYISEVIPIRYALADDIANALNSLGGSGGSTVSIGASSATPTVSGMSHPGGAAGGAGGMGTTGGSQYPGVNQGQQRTFGTQGTTGTPARGTTFQQRLQSIIQRASTGGQQDQIQVFGQTKIIADQRSNSLLVFATAADMERIKAVVSKLDVLLAQVLIEAVIVDVSLGNSLSYGVSAVQEQRNGRLGNTDVKTVGVMNNNQPFYQFLQSVATNGGSILPGLASTPPNNLSYFGNIGGTWDVALQAAANDSSASIIQRPRVQTSQAKPAQFFVGQTVPYITGYYNNGYGNQSSYSQLSVGVELDVTPFINPDGLVVMDINQEIDDLGDPVKIDGNDVYKTVKRTMSSEIAVKDRDTIILGGFVRAERSKSRSGVPLLQDIPILGHLFSSSSRSKQRSELIVLMRPTVLRTPEIAAAQAVREGQRLPGASAAAAEEAAYLRKAVAAERRTELKHARTSKEYEGFFAPGPGDMLGDTNRAAPLNP